MHRERGAGTFTRDDARLGGLQTPDLLDRRCGVKLIRPFDPRRALQLQLIIQRALIAIRPVIIDGLPRVTSRPRKVSLCPLDSRAVG